MARPDASADDALTPERLGFVAAAGDRPAWRKRVGKLECEFRLLRD